MTTHRLSFCNATLLAPDIAEIIIDGDVEVDADMLVEYHSWIRNHLPDPCFLLINKVNPYTYTFKAQMEMADPLRIKAMATVVYSEASFETTELLLSLPRERPWNLQIFTDRDAALMWLKKQRRKW